MLLYLHGFRSSPQSFKARATHEFLAARGTPDVFVCPAQPFDPAAAVALIERTVEAALARGVRPLLVGSSLGGYYATWCAEKYGLRAALVNPAVVAHVALADYVGPQSNMYTGEVFDFTLAHVEALRRIEVPGITPERYLLLVETGDEVLDYRQATARYAGCRQIVLEGGDHSFTRFAEFLPAILEFGQL